MVTAAMRGNISDVHLPMAKDAMLHCGGVISWLLTKSEENQTVQVGRITS